MPPEAVAAFAPGRVNLIGEHTDYNAGLALPFAIAEGVTVTAAGLPRPWVIAHALDLGEDDEFALDAAVRPAPGWRAFLRGVVAELLASGMRLRGSELRIDGSVPRGAGLSSSAALEVALCLALLGVAGEPAPGEWDLARLCSRVENDWVGAQTGLLDQLASVCGERDTALRIDFQAETVDRVPLRLGQWRLVTLDSGEGHSLAASGYNRRRAECAEACDLLGISTLRHATEEMAARLPSPLSARVRHVIGENGRVDATVAALGRGDLEQVGRLLDASHASLRDLYDVSTPAVEAAVARLRDAGAAGARVVGGGFGGHVLGLLPPGVQGPAGAREVRPGSGAQLVDGDAPTEGCKSPMDGCSRL